MASKFLNLSTDTSLGGNSPSDYLAPSEKAIKTYVDSHRAALSVASDTNGNLIISTDNIVVSDDNNGNVILTP